MTPTSRQVLERLLARHGRTYADEVGIDLRSGGPAALFQLLVASLLMSARISERIAVAAAQALSRRGYTSPQRMLDASWQDRVDALGEGHYVRYDESTATYLGETAEWVLDRHGGDLRLLREEGDGDVDRLRRLLEEFTGIGRVGADIFLREVQAVWSELRPVLDEPAARVARELGLGGDPRDLARLHGDDDLSAVASGLVRARLADDLETLRRGDRAAPTDLELERMTRDELYDLARSNEVAGRSSMSRDELADALRSRSA